METAGFAKGILTLLGKIKTTIDNVKALPEACKRLQNDVNVFYDTLETYQKKLDETNPPWLSSLEKALEEALETVQVCVDKPFRAKLKASYYNNKIKDTRDKIRDALEHMSVYGVISIERLSDDVQDLGDVLVNEVRETQNLIQQVMMALKENQEGKLLEIANEHDLQNVRELQKELLENQQFLKNTKDDVEEQLIKVAEIMSKLAIEFYSECPDAYKCPLTRERMEDPYILNNSGHTYERAALLRALAQKPNVDPLTNKKFEGEFQLKPNITLKKSIAEWVEKQKNIIYDPNFPDPSPDPSPPNPFKKFPKKVIAWGVLGLTIVVIIIVATVLITVPPPTPPLSSTPTTSPLPSISMNPTPNSLFLRSQNISPPKDESFSSPSTNVDISNTNIIVGNPQANNMIGELYVYNIDGLYLHTIQAPDGNEGDQFAFSVSIHNDLIVVGAPWRKRGKAYIHHVSGDLFAELTPPDSMDGDQFGFNVGITDSHIAIGAPGNGLGKAYIYTTVLNPVGIPIEVVPNDLDERGGFARTLSVSGDHVVFGAPSQDNERGVSYLYSTTGEKIAKLEASDGQAGDWFGFDVAIDGDVVVVGAPRHDNDRGAIYVFNLEGNEISKVMDPDGREGDRFGWHVNVSTNYIVVRTRGNVIICNKAGRILAKRDAPGVGDVALTDEKLVVYDNSNNGDVILMHH